MSPTEVTPVNSLLFTDNGLFDSLLKARNTTQGVIGFILEVEAKNSSHLLDLCLTNYHSTDWQLLSRAISCEPNLTGHYVHFPSVL